MILKWWSFEYKVKSLKIFGVVFPEVKNADILDFSWMKYFCNDFSFHINDIYGSAIVKVKDRGTWKQNWKQTFDCKLVYILGKTVQDMVLDS